MHMRIPRNELLAEMKTLTDWSMRIVGEFRGSSLEALRHQPAPGAWNALQCLDHLCRYGDHYLPAMEKAILSYDGQGESQIFNTGVLGGYFAALMRGKNGRITKMTSPKAQTPAAPDLPLTTIDRFLHQQEQLLRILELAAATDLRRITVPISLNRMIRLRLGDTLRFYVYHIERHVLQAQRALRATT